MRPKKLKDGSSTGLHTMSVPDQQSLRWRRLYKFAKAQRPHPHRRESSGKGET